MPAIPSQVCTASMACFTGAHTTLSKSRDAGYARLRLAAVREVLYHGGEVAVENSRSLFGPANVAAGKSV
eukprot:6176383-Pleurochrysis_carterae.AAC.1